MAKKEKKVGGLFKEFKEFISRGNVIDLAVGVIIGGAFSAIITAVVNGIFMPLISMVTGGGLQGFVTVLNHSKALATAESVNVVTYWGVKYDADVVNVINWGNLINAVINFLIIALVLFTIVKITNIVAKKNAELKAKALEEYYQKHPEERPEPEKPGAPVPTELDYLREIRDALVKKK